VDVAVAHSGHVPVVGQLQDMAQFLGTIPSRSLEHGHQDTDQGGGREGKIVAVEDGVVVEQAMGEVVGQIHHDLGGGQFLGGEDLGQVIQWRQWRRWKVWMRKAAGTELLVVYLDVVGRRREQEVEAKVEPHQPGDQQPQSSHDNAADLGVN